MLKNITINKSIVKLILIFLILLLNFNFSNSQIIGNTFNINKIYPEDIKTGAERFDEYLSLISNKNIAIVGNQTSMIGETHLVDTLLSFGINIKSIMSPEHGFRGNAGAGELVKDGKDTKTGLPIISLYGGNKKPKAEQLKDIDIVLFDLQDVGLRFYTYISTLQYVMEACAEQNITVIVLDRPNPNGFYVDGPILEKKYKSFIGMNPVPVVHGLTVGEYALMLNGEKWLANELQCDLKVIPVKDYTHKDLYQLPIAPSPNLPNMESVYLYPSLCFFEGTPISIGRGTDFPFQFIGHPEFIKYDTILIPEPIEGIVKNPKLNNEKCKGFIIKDLGYHYAGFQSIRLNWLIYAYNQLEKPDDFFTNFFNLLAGTDKLREQIIAGKSEDEIRKTWEEDLKDYKLMRKKYLLYEDFE